MNTSITNKNGSISVYGFACGYVEKKEIVVVPPEFNGSHLVNTGIYVSSQIHLEHGAFMIRYVNKVTDENILEVAENITDARKCHANFCRLMKSEDWNAYYENQVKKRKEIKREIAKNVDEKVYA